MHEMKHALVTMDIWLSSGLSNEWHAGQIVILSAATRAEVKVDRERYCIYLLVAREKSIF